MLKSGELMHDKILKTFSHSDSSAPDVFPCFHLIWSKRGKFLKSFFDKIFVKCCFSPSDWCSTLAVPCCTHPGRQEHLDLRRVDVHPAGRVKDAFELQGLRWFNSKWTSRSGHKQMLLVNSWNLLKEWSTVAKEHNRSVSSSRPLLLPSRGQMFGKATRTSPAALLLPFCCVSFISTLWFCLESKHRHCPFS